MGGNRNGLYTSKHQKQSKKPLPKFQKLYETITKRSTQITKTTRRKRFLRLPRNPMRCNPRPNKKSIQVNIKYIIIIIKYIIYITTTIIKESSVYYFTRINSLVSLKKNKRKTRKSS